MRLELHNIYQKSIAGTATREFSIVVPSLNVPVSLVAFAPIALAVNDYGM